MKLLKQIVLLFSVGIFILACSSSPLKNTNTKKEEPVVIANDSLEYEITIIDPGFTAYLYSIAQPVGYYSQNYLETRNRLFVTNWNIRARTPFTYDSNIYENEIDYEQGVDYGYDVNYKLFNYFMFAQKKYKMSLASGLSNRTR